MIKMKHVASRVLTKHWSSSVASITFYFSTILRHMIHRELHCSFLEISLILSHQCLRQQMHLYLGVYGLVSVCVFSYSMLHLGLQLQPHARKMVLWRMLPEWGFLGLVGWTSSLMVGLISYHKQIYLLRTEDSFISYSCIKEVIKFRRGGLHSHRHTTDAIFQRPCINLLIGC